MLNGVKVNSPFKDLFHSEKLPDLRLLLLREPRHYRHSKGHLPLYLQTYLKYHLCILTLLGSKHLSRMKLNLKGNLFAILMLFFQLKIIEGVLAGTLYREVTVYGR